MALHTPLILPDVIRGDDDTGTRRPGRVNTRRRRVPFVICVITPRPELEIIPGIKVLHKCDRYHATRAGCFESIDGIAVVHIDIIDPQPYV